MTYGQRLCWGKRTQRSRGPERDPSGQTYWLTDAFGRQVHRQPGQWENVHVRGLFISEWVSNVTLVMYTLCVSVCLCVWVWARCDSHIQPHSPPPHVYMFSKQQHDGGLWSASMFPTSVEHTYADYDCQLHQNGLKFFSIADTIFWGVILPKTCRHFALERPCAPSL